MIEPYYEQDGITIYHADCLDVLPQLEAVDHVITDPPYEADAHTKGRRVKRIGAPLQDEWAWRGRSGEAVRYERLPFAAITDEARASVSTEVARLARRWALVFCQAEAAHEWERVLVENGLTRRRWCVWVKPDGQPQFSGDRPGVGYETIVACHAKGRSTWNGGGRTGVFVENKYDGGGAPNPHPTTKPIRLMRDLIVLFTDEGDLILDPFMGSGTTLRAAKDLGRRAIGIEINKDYCDIAIERLRQGVLL